MFSRYYDSEQKEYDGFSSPLTPINSNDYEMCEGFDEKAGSIFETGANYIQNIKVGEREEGCSLENNSVASVTSPGSERFIERNIRSERTVKWNGNQVNGPFIGSLSRMENYAQPIKTGVSEQTDGIIGYLNSLKVFLKTADLSMILKGKLQAISRLSQECIRAGEIRRNPVLYNFVFDLRQFNKRKRTKICHCYSDPSDPSRYIINNERKFRIIACPQNQKILNRLRSMGKTGVVICLRKRFVGGNESGGYKDSIVEEFEVRKIQNENCADSYYIEALDICRKEAYFQVFVKFGSAIVGKSRVFHVKGYSDSYFRKKQFPGFVRKCGNGDILY